MRKLQLILLYATGVFSQQCSEVLEPLGLKDAEALAAHGSHSLTLNMIQYFFNPKAAEDNGIPTVNLNRSFDNPAFFALDNILSNMDHEEYGIMNANTLDRIAHDLHMIHMWEGAALYYQALVTAPPKPEICSCFLSTYLEAIKANLEFIAKEIRIPNQLSSQNNKGVKKGGNERAHYLGEYLGEYLGIYLGRYIGVYTLESRTINEKGPGNETAIKKKGGADDRKLDLYSGNIVDEKSWAKWKEMMQDPDSQYMENMGRSLSLYLYCQLEN